ncbi:MAG: hypothetical protein KC425_20495 [Anaerolineales bacterium]|nr:hypothetical protein [Anaerolineales bacterium]
MHPNPSPPRHGRFLTLSLVLITAAVVLTAGIAWLAAGPLPVAAQEPAETPAPDGLSPAARAWIATVDQQRALNIPDDVQTFTELRSWLQTTNVTPGAAGANGTLPPRDLGTVQVQSGPGPCNPDDGRTCYDLRVTCSQTTRDFRLTAKIGQPPAGTPTQGTILMSGGFDGTYYWEEGVPAATEVITDLHAAGFQTVQLRWTVDWRYGEPGADEGLENLNCSWSTVAQWVYDNVHESQTAYCATGHSNGATQVGFGLTQYGHEELFDAVLFEGGPNYVRTDTGCLDTMSPLYYPGGERSAVNISYGLPGNTGACVTNDVAYQARFEESSLSFADWPYSYPDTAVAFIFGENDTTNTAVHGNFYHDRLVAGGTPTITLQVVTGTGHFVTNTPQGREAIANTLINACVLRHTIPSIALTTTVGTDPGSCAAADAITVGPNTDVTFCYEVTNNGTTALSLHDLADTAVGPILNGLSYALAPGASVFVTQTITLPTQAIAYTSVNTATWTAYNAGPSDVVTATDTAAVTVLPHYAFLASIQE